MNTIRLTGYVDDERLLHLQLPGSVPPGQVDVVVKFPSSDEDDAGRDWMHNVAHEWADELSDEREEIYTLADGKPLDGSR